MTTSWIGYRVESYAGRIGSVAGIVASTDGSCSLLLAVRLGGSGRQVVHYPLDEIGVVDTRNEVVVLGPLEPPLARTA